ncbi:MAG: hypothetical protein ACRDE5_14545, partial [Ginsengibacter sp.]
MKKSEFYTILLFFLILSCNEKVKKEDAYSMGTIPCQGQPSYLAQTGLNPQSSALSTSEKKIKGLVLIELIKSPSGITRGKTWQHKSWSRYGWMGPITTDDRGNSYVAPVPVINVIDNPKEKQNIIYKVDSHTAEMAPLIELPVTPVVNHENPYGLLGLYFDCDARILYASSIFGSDKNNERGIIYAIDPQKRKVIDSFKSIDGMGLCVGGISGQKRLYIGSGRNSNVYSIELLKNGKFTGPLKEEFSLDMFGPRGDDKARKIRFDRNGNMLVAGIEFNYNLAAASEKQETTYRFMYN